MKVDSVADFKNMNKTNYKDTRITLTEAVPFLLLTLNMFWLAGTFLEITNQRNSKKQVFKPSENLKDRHDYFYKKRFFHLSGA